MAINIPTKSDKQASQLRDALRIIAWQQFKSDNRVSGIEAYEQFSAEWDEHEIHKMNLKQIQKLLAELGYSITDMLQIRSEYYRNRDRMNGNGQAVNGKGQGVNGNGLEPINDDIPVF